MECNQEEERDFFQSEQGKNDSFDFNLEKEIEYYDEIYSIMHAFGDVRKPLSSSVKLMCNILESQLALLMEMAENIMKLREGNKISHEDLLFLLRRNKIMLKRLLHFLSVEDTRSYLLPGLGGGVYPEKGERVSECLKYLAVIEKYEGHLTTIFKDKTLIDNVYLRRLKRRDLMTSSMTKDEYENFFEYTLKVSFCYKHSNEIFKKWLQQCSCIKLDITPIALSIIHFLARETIAGIVEKALEIKSRKYKSDIFPSRKFHELKYGSDLDESEVKLDLHESAKRFSSDKLKIEIDKSENYLQPSSSKISEYNSKRNENSDIEVNSFTQSSSVSMQEMNLLSGASLDNIVNCSVEDSITDISSSDNQKKKAVSISSHLNKNVSSKSCSTKKSNVSKSKGKIASHFSDANKSLPHCAGKRKKKCDICDNSKLDKKNSDTYYVIGEGTNSTLNCEVEIDQASSSVQCNVPGAFKKVTKKPYFSLNFQEKTLSIYCDGSETFEIDTDTKRKQTRKANKNNVIKVMGSKDPTKFCFMEPTEESEFDGSKREHHISKCLPSDSDLPFVLPIFKDSKIHWFPHEPITPTEIQAAFIYYQHPLPMSYLMKTELPSLPKKPNLVCLADPDELDIY